MSLSQAQPGPFNSIQQQKQQHHHHDQPSSAQAPHCDQATTDHTTTLVELSISCLDLPDCDVITKSDPQVFLYLLDLAGANVKCELGRTELINDDLNPKFAKKILVHYHFEQIQRLKFEVWDIDPVGSNDFLGGLETTLAEVVASRSSAFKRPLVGGPRKKPGYLIVEVEELVACKQVISFVLGAIDLPASCCSILAPSASCHIYRSNENGSKTIVHRTPVVPRNCNPSFKPFQMKMVTLCNGDLDRTIRFEILDQRLNLNRNLGFFETTVKSLKAFSKQNQGNLFNLLDDSYHGSNANNCCKAIISDFKIINQASFLDYIKAGTQIHFVVAIDFTASNGDPNLPESLHYLDPMGRRMNPYEAALNAVGRILGPYDNTGLFAGFGFGAKLNGPNMAPSHLFPLNGNHQHPYVSSIEQLIQVYRSKLGQVILSGPTNFSPCISHCHRIASEFENGNHYFVLLIVTDGIISDMLQTKKAIIEASNSPLSIIICGVGDAEFSAMNELDSDDVVMQVGGKFATRDIVQFVPMNQFIPKYGSPSTREAESRRLLAEEVLREIPDQLTGFMVSRGFHPELTYITD